MPKEESDSENEIYLGEDAEGSIYVDKAELKEALIANKVIDDVSLDLLTDQDNLNINIKLKNLRDSVDQKVSDHNRENKQSQLEKLQNSLKPGDGDDEECDESDQLLANSQYNESKSVNMDGVPSKESIEVSLLHHLLSVFNQN